MPIPIPVLLAAAAKAAQDPRTQRAARAAYEAGSGAIARWRAGKTQTAPPPAIKEQPRRRGAVSRRWRFRKGQSGDLIRFDYVDGDGLRTARMVGNWTSDGRVLRGYCLHRKGECDFAIAGIAQWEEVAV